MFDKVCYWEAFAKRCTSALPSHYWMPLIYFFTCKFKHQCQLDTELSTNANQIQSHLFLLTKLKQQCQLDTEPFIHLYLPVTRSLLANMQEEFHLIPIQPNIAMPCK